MSDVTVTLPRNIANAFREWLAKTPMPTPALKREAADAQEALEAALKDVAS